MTLAARTSAAPKRTSSSADPLNLCARQARLIGTALIWASALVMVMPFLLRGPSAGADFIFHYTSWHDALKSWQHGIAYPHWASSPNFGAGEPRFVFYPPLVWMLGAALGAVLPWHAVPIALSFVLLAATGFATRALARRFVPEAAAALAGCTAIFSGYLVYEVYYHGDFALVSGGFWIPLLLLLFLKQQDSAPTSLVSRTIDRHTLPLALVLTGTWLSNTPLGLMATYLLATMALLSAWQSRSWTPVIRVALAIALGLGLASFYIVPAAVEQHWVDIQKLFASPEHLIQNRWLTSELRSAHERKRGLIEIVMLGMAFGGLLVTWRRNQWPSTANIQTRRGWLLLAFLPAAILFLMLPVSLPVWNIVPRLRYLEYPWRWAIVLQVPMAIFFAAAVWSTRGRLRPFALTLCGVLFLAAAFGSSASKSLFRPARAARSGPYSLAAMDRALSRFGEGVGGADEYATPPGARNELIAADLPDACLVHDPLAPLSTVRAQAPTAFYTPLAWSAGSGTCQATFGADLNRSSPEHLHLTAQTTQPGYLVLRLRNYPAWKVLVNGERTPSLPKRADGLLTVPVPQGRVDLNIDWTTTPDVVVGRLLSALSALIALGIWSLARKRVAVSAESRALATV